MEAQKYPIGIQSFPELIEEGYRYVDKTRFVGELVKEGKYIFLSRPRRFGKSLLLSTLHAYFDGKRELFKGLALEKMDMDWTPSPVLHFDLNSGVFDNEDGLLTRLDNSLAFYEEQYGVETNDRSRNAIPIRLERIIKAAYNQTARKVVILVDEYDKPLLGIEENKDVFEKNQVLLKGFYGNLKSMDAYIKFALLTGVTRFNKVSIFSDVNNLKDISMYERYAEICGWTEEELKHYFQPGIQALAFKRNEKFEDTLATLRNYYDGYLFSEEGNRLYNPFSVLMALDSQRIKPYWFETATPTFLAKRVKANGIDPASLNGETSTYKELVNIGLGTGNPIPLMFQTGYLTIARYDNVRDRYELRFPNREVEIGFAEYLLPLYMPNAQRGDSVFSLQHFQNDLFNGKPQMFMQRFETLLKDLPVGDQSESTYRALTYLLCILSGTNSIAERHSYKGRSDLEVSTPDYIYVFEFKYNRSVKEALKQIHDRDYAGRFKLSNQKIFLIGANFTENKNNRGLKYKIEEFN